MRAMSNRGNKPVGGTARLLMLLCLVTIIIGVIVAVFATRSRQAYPDRGALPGQVEKSGLSVGKN